MIVDVSVYQGAINWPAVKADHIELAIMKATEGVGFIDPRFTQNWAGAAAAGVRRGAYHFARPDLGNNAIAEADYFLSIVKPGPADVLALDYEVPGGFAPWCLAWLADVHAKTGSLPEFYSNYSGCARVASDARMAMYPLWLAYPGDGVHAPPVPAPWHVIGLWQFAVGKVPGIPANVDEDVNLGLFGAVGSSLGDEMTPDQDKKLNEIHDALIKNSTGGVVPEYAPWSDGISKSVAALATQIKTIPAEPAEPAEPTSTPIDPKVAADLATLAAFLHKLGLA